MLLAVLRSYFDRAVVLRSELLECFVRIAVTKYRYMDRSELGTDISDCVQKLLIDCVEANAPNEVLLDPDIWRRSRFYLEEVDNMLKSHARPLRILFDMYSMLNPIAGKPRFGLEEVLLNLNCKLDVALLLRLLDFCLFVRTVACFGE